MIKQIHISKDDLDYIIEKLDDGNGDKQSVQILNNLIKQEKEIYGDDKN